MAVGQDQHARPIEPPAPQAQRQWARQSHPDAASWAVLVYYKKNLWQPLLEIVPFIVLASETIKFSKLLPKQIFNPVNSRACNCLKQIGMCITLKSLLFLKSRPTYFSSFIAKTCLFILNQQIIVLYVPQVWSRELNAQ